MNIRLCLAVAGLTQIVGCASIVGGTNQSVSVETRDGAGPVAGANCKLENPDGTWFVTTPGSTVVKRAYDQLIVHCEKQGYESGRITAKSTTKGMAFGNILLGGFIGAGVDVATGAAYDYPPLLTVTLGIPREPISPQKSSVAQGPVPEHTGPALAEADASQDAPIPE